MNKLGTFILLAMVSVANAQQRGGTLSGLVTSAEDGAPLVGATIVIQNTTLGTSSNEIGRFVLKGVPVGKQALVVSMVGFQRKIVGNVNIESDSETRIDIQLVASPIKTDAVVVTASKHEQTLAEVPISMSIVDSRTLAHRSTIAVDDALRYVPGVNLAQSQVNIRGSSGYSRGVGSRVLLLVDGLPLLAGDTGEPIFESIPAFQIERIEVVKGAGSALYGTSALGGVINVITRDVPEDAETRWRFYAKLYDNPPHPKWKWSDKPRFMNAQYVSHAQRVGELSFILAGSRLVDDSYRENDWLRRYNGYAKLKYDISPFHSIAASSNVMWQHRGDFIWWKDFNNTLRPADSQLNFSVTSFRINSSLLFKHFVSDDFYYDLKAIHYHSNWHEDSLEVARANESKSNVATVEIQANYVLDEGNLLTVGAVANVDEVSSDIFGKHGGFGGAFYAQDELQPMKNLRFTLGARYDYQKVATLATSRQFNPKFGARYSLDENTSLRATVGRGFRAPSIAELFVATSVATSTVAIVPSIDLKPEHSWSYEAGGTRRISENVLWDFALFQSDFSDLIEAGVEFDSLRNAPVVRFRNVTQARVQGFESNLQTSLFNRLLSLDVNYTYNWPYDVREKKILKFRPRHIASANAVLNYADYIFGADFRYISQVDAIDDQLVRLAPIVDGEKRVPIYIVDIRASTTYERLGFPVRVNFQVNNLLRYSYVELIGNMAPLRNFVLSVEGAF